jgi:hypothetical protein
MPEQQQAGSPRAMQNHRGDRDEGIEVTIVLGVALAVAALVMKAL